MGHAGNEKMYNNYKTIIKIEYKKQLDFDGIIVYNKTKKYG